YRGTFKNCSRMSCMAMKTLSTIVNDSNAGRVDLIVRELSQTSRSQVRGLIDHDCVKINGSPCRNVGSSAGAGDLVEICYDPHTRYREKKRRWEDRAFQVVFEDEHLIVVDKSAGTLTVPSDRREPNSLHDRVSLYISHSKTAREACLVHRLDREISGLLVFGKHPPIAELLIQQFKDRKPNRVYQAIVSGLLEADEGTFRSHLATGNNLDRYETRPSKSTDEAVTHYKVLQRMADTTLVELTLDTGKRNQVRVQFSGAGHPVLGDPKYKPKQAKHERWVRNRIALHAGTLGFIHPVTGKEVRCETGLPRAMQKFISGARHEVANRRAHRADELDTTRRDEAPEEAGRRPKRSPWKKGTR
ncbi:MAG: RluA family pseudouridine synthase, partial [Planctomycetota bacterium]